MKRRNIKQSDTNATRLLTAELGLNNLASFVLTARGITEPEEALSFLQGGEISDPFLIKNMDKAVETIKTALIKGDKIVVFGDYDCDGVTSTVMLVQYLTAQGGEVEWYIPSRDDGYGLNIEAVDKLAGLGAKLIITVDNGVSAHKEADYIKEKGIKLVITDHHTVSDEVLPVAEAVINPKRPDDNSPFKQLAGCGVVLKLIMALEGDIEGVLEQFADLAALGTIADVVPLTGENRVIVRRGLEIMPYTENVGLYKLLRQSGFLLDDDDNSDRLTASALSFTACPRINAAGRFDHAGKAVELLLCENEAFAELKAQELTELNNSRRETEAEILQQVNLYLSEEPSCLSERVLIVKGDNWHSGVIGIIASKMLSKFGKPVIVITNDGEFIKGSARSIEEFPLMPLLEGCKEILVKYGGHVKAAGFTAASVNLDKFIEHVHTFSKIHYKEMPFDSVNVDKVLEAEDLTLENTNGLKVLAPFGEANLVPLFLLCGVILSKKPLKEGKFLSFNVRIGNLIQKVLHFGSSYNEFHYEAGQAVEVLVTLDVNEYNGVRSVNAQCKDIRSAGFNEARHFAAVRAYEALVRGEEGNRELASRIIPEKAELKTVYDIIRRVNYINLASCDCVYAQSLLNYCKFRIILDVLVEFKLIEHDIINNTISLLPANGKIDFESSKTLNRVKRLLAEAGIGLG